MNYDVIIVGTGAAGLFCALHLPSRLKVGMLTKSDAQSSDSYLAQGGICVMRGEADYIKYFEDTLKAGHYENDRQAVDLMIRSSGTVLQELMGRGVSFQQEQDSRVAYTREGAHSCARIMYHKDITGKEITQTLLDAVIALPNVEIMENATMLDIIEANNTCGGVVISDDKKHISAIHAPIVVLCCGGLGGLYTHSTNYPHITGDALAIALKHGIELENIDYIQIHPTTLYTREKGRRFLISESVRGEGGVLYNKNMQRFTNELLPRDKLSQSIYRQLEKDGTDFVWEDMRPIGKETILDHFPNIHEQCLKSGFDVLKEPIPVVPAQHYIMGGIKVNLSSQTSMKGLYACGETSCNGVHGRNRLASNSLLEALVFAQRAAQDITFGGNNSEKPSIPAPDLGSYEDQNGLFQAYREIILNEIERMNNNREQNYNGASGRRLNQACT
ncbi:MAG: L-aspartate oxidase [Lachnospiraceae bacterium]